MDERNLTTSTASVMSEQELRWRIFIESPYDHMGLKPKIVKQILTQAKKQMAAASP